jgi:D-3-phosphoglycerate dehydrogenase
MSSSIHEPTAETSRFRVVHTAAGFVRDWQLEREALAAIGARFEPVTAESEDELIAACRTADAIIVVRERFTRRVIEALERARVIVRSGVGYDVIDVPAATERGIAVCTIPDYCTQEVANHALALLLAVNRRLRELDAAVRAGRWRGGDLPSIGPLYGQTVGIVGYGRIGRAMAARCRALGLRVLAADPYTGPPDADDRIVPLDELLAEADYVSIHCLLNEETRGLIDERALRRMKPTAILVNTARGPIVDQRALTRALREGWIAGAGLDVCPTWCSRRTRPTTLTSPPCACASGWCRRWCARSPAAARPACSTPRSGKRAEPPSYASGYCQCYAIRLAADE